MLRLDKIRRGGRGGPLKNIDSFAAREEARKFVFDEFMKVDPDEVSFYRPDSGSGINYSDENNDSDDDDNNSEENVDEEELRREQELKDLDRKSRAN